MVDMIALLTGCIYSLRATRGIAVGEHPLLAGAPSNNIYKYIYIYLYACRCKHVGVGSTFRSRVQVVKNRLRTKKRDELSPPVCLNWLLSYAPDMEASFEKQRETHERGRRVIWRINSLYIGIVLVGVR